MSSILVIGPSWVGDMVMAQSLFRVLRETNPDCAIDVLAPAWALPLVERMPEVRAGIPMPIGHGELRLSERRRIGRSLRDHGYDQAIVLPNSFKSALIPWWAQIPKRTGFVGELRQWLLNDCRKLDKTALPMTVQRFVALGLPDGAMLSGELPSPCFEVDSNAGHDAMQKFAIDSRQRSVLGLCPGAEFGPAKKWPEAYYAELASHWLDRDWQVWLFGSANDRDVCERIDAGTGGRCENLAGKTSLGEAIDLLAETGFVVSNDSGLMHVAAALRRPMVAIYGSSDPGFTPPLSETAEVVRLGLDCSPCFKRECPLGHLDCLNKLPTAMVLDAMEGVMKR